MSDGEPDLDITPEPPSEPPPSGPPPVVLMRAEVLAAIRAHAAEDLNTELGGVLIGNAAEGPEGTLVLIEGSIRALHTDATRGSITFTHETWNAINEAKDRDFPERRIVGWYHTHPGFGLFLSGFDLFIQRNFFDLPWQVAVVVDPRANTAGVFVWQGGEIVGPREVEVVSGPAGIVQASPAAAAGNALGPPGVETLGARLWRSGPLRWVVTALLVLVLAAQVLIITRRPAPQPPPAAPRATPPAPSRPHEPLPVTPPLPSVGANAAR